MKYFVPVLRFAQELPPQTEYQDKLGGIPWGLRPGDWPRCTDCGKSLSLLAQFAHHPERLDLGRPGRVLNVFQCNHRPGDCETWEGGHGANACFVKDPEELSPALTEVPADAPFIEDEVRVVEWSIHDDGLTPEEYHNFFADETMPDDDEVLDRITSDTRLGGTPLWIQSPYEAPKGDWQFVGQLDSCYWLHTAPSQATCDALDVHINALNTNTDGSLEVDNGHTHFCPGPNFGSGIGYIFLRIKGGTPEGWFFWQC
ncbi:MAG: hypothetical protein AAF889_14270 [Cyanobacteria bacterium P01_D01_bin.73]